MSKAIELMDELVVHINAAGVVDPGQTFRRFRMDISSSNLTENQIYVLPGGAILSNNKRGNKQRQRLVEVALVGPTGRDSTDGPENADDMMDVVEALEDALDAFKPTGFCRATEFEEDAPFTAQDNDGNNVLAASFRLTFIQE